MPEDRLYDLETEVWLEQDPGGRTARIGLLATLGAFVGRFTHVAFLVPSGPIGRGRSVAVLESVRSVVPVRVPVRGSVVETNALLLQRPRTLNEDPYGAGWVARIELDDPGDPARWLEPAQAIRDRLAERIARNRIRCLPAVPDVEMFEIGSECQAVLVRLDEEIARRSEGEVIHLVTDDPTAPIEMVRWQDRTGQPVLDHRVEGALHHFLVRKVGHPTPRAPSEV